MRRNAPSFPKKDSALRSLLLQVPYQNAETFLSRFRTVECRPSQLNKKAAQKGGLTIKIPGL